MPATADDTEALRVSTAAGGAAPLAWICLIALTMTLYAVLPRMLAAVAVSVWLWGIARNMAVPASVVPYASRVFVETVAESGGTTLSAQIPRGVPRLSWHTESCLASDVPIGQAISREG